MDPLDHSVTDALRGWKTQFEAGIPMSASLELCAPVCRGSLARQSFQRAANMAASGGDFTTVLENLASILPPAERGALRAGFKHGRFEHTLGSVIEHRELWYRTRQRIRSKMILPAATLLLAAVIAPLPMLFSTGSVVLYFMCVGTPIGLGLAAWIAFSRIMQARAMNPTANSAGPLSASSLDRWLLGIPVVKNVERNRNLAEFAGLTSPLIGSGATLADALELSSEVLPNGFYRGDLAACAKATRGGSLLSDTLRPNERWPAEFLAAVAVGEKSGALEETMRHQAVQLRERYTAAVEQLGEWLPKIAYAIVALFIVVNILIIFTGYVSMLTDLSKGN